jgi:glycine hydroxymethyltransferase
MLAAGLGSRPSPGDVKGLRIGTPELVRIGATTDDMADLAGLITRGLAEDDVAADVTAWLKQFAGVHYIAG